MEKLSYFLRIMIRNFFNRGKLSFINIVGLTAGLTVSLLILIYVRYEASFDNFNPNSGNIYRIVEKNKQDGSVGAATPVALCDVLKRDFPEIDQVIGLIRTRKEVRANGERFENFNGAIVDNNFFELFNLPIKQGNPGTIFQDPYEIVITRSLANKLFSENNPIGKTIEYENHPFIVTGVINNIPSNSIMNFDYFLSGKFRYISYPDISERWYDFGLYTFVTFKAKKCPVGFEQKLTGIEKQYYPDFMKDRFSYLLVPFKGCHLNPLIENDMVAAIPPIYLWILSAIAIGILIIACLNFINISIAGAGKKKLATGIKKVNGASSGALIGNFFAETAVTILLCLLLAFLGVYLLLPPFKDLIEKNISIDLADPIFWAGTTGFCILTILLSGIYPSVILSRPSPVKALLQKNISTGNKMTFQKVFVVLQFAITIVLAITLLFIFKQISFMQNHETGFDKGNLITMSARSLGNNRGERMKNTTLFIQELEKYQAQYGYGKASVTEFVPGFGYKNLFKIFPEEESNKDGIELLSCDIDENFLEVYGLHMLYGRFFSNAYGTDKDAVILNESALKKMGWKTIESKQIGLFTKDNIKKVVGVINDINVKSLQYPIEPVIYQFGAHHNYPGYITVRLNPANKDQSIEFIKQEWNKLFPDVPFWFESIDEKYNTAYGDEKRLAKITSIFSFLAMVLSLLGVFALSTLESEKRTKEIGIRKVNGAKIAEVMALLNKKFIIWIGIAFIIATPLAYYAMHKWLQNFAYKTELSWWLFAAAGAIALVIALLTVSWQSWRAATRNPVEALRYE